MPNAPFNSGLYRFRVGDFECVSIAANSREIPSPQPTFAPQASPADFREALAEAGLPPAPLRMHYNVLLIRNGRDNILVDAGFPAGSVAPAFDLSANLASLGLSAADITAVLLSHAHADHIGGLLDADGRAVFSRAEHFCSAEEHAFWTSPEPDYSRSRIDAESRAASIARARNLFDRIPFSHIKPGSPLPDGLSTLLAPGHTPGHLNFRIHSRGETLHHIVDLAHHFALMIPRPEWTVSFDVDEALAVAARREIFPRLAAEGVRVFGYHLPFPALGRIVAARDGSHRWAPAPWDPGVR